MSYNKKNLEKFQQYIHEHRGNEINFEKLNTRLNQEIEDLEEEDSIEAQTYIQDLKESKEKLTEPYLKLKEVNGSAWPEFEKFVTNLERTITSGLRSFQ